MTTSQTLRIRALNDRLRQTGVGGQILMTLGISSLSYPLLMRVAEGVQTFGAFTPDNDPYGEHDFGAVTVAGERVLWKIDYYSPDMLRASVNPADASKTVRVLTIMLASEY